jgi:hypothetical protein
MLYPEFKSKHCHPKTVTVGERSLMANVHYKGILGEFDYNDSEFKITYATDPYTKDVIRYIGDSPNPVIPEGIRRCDRLFVNCTLIEVAPVIPESVRYCNRMFANCTNLRTVYNLPKKLFECRGMFENCTSLETSPQLGCIRDCSYMFNGCSSLKIAPEIPNNANDCRGMFKNCVNINNAPKIPKYASYGDIFYGTKFYGTCVRK